MLGAAAEAGGGFANLGECQAAIETLFELEIEFGELREIVERLVGAVDALAALVATPEQAEAVLRRFAGR